MSQAVTEVDEDYCTICHKPRSNHPYRHAFSPYGESSGLFEKTEEKPSPPDSSPQQQVRIPSSGDPILRMVLLRKGLITVQDLDQVEAELKATGVSGYEPPNPVG